MTGPRVGESDEAYARRLEREVDEEVGATDEENEQANMDSTGMHYGEQATFGGEQTFVGGASGSNPYYGGQNPGSYDRLCNEMRGMRSDFSDFRAEYRRDFREHREHVDNALGTLASTQSGFIESVQRRWADEDVRRATEDQRWSAIDAEMRAQQEHRAAERGFWTSDAQRWGRHFPPPPPNF